MLVGSLVREAEAAPSCDELREQQVDDDHGQDGDGVHHVHLAHIELQEVCTAQLCDQDGQGLLIGGIQDQSGDEVVVPAGHEGEDGLHRRLDLLQRQPVHPRCAAHAGRPED